MTFFPHLVAGPIVRAKDFLPQIVSPQIINSSLYKESILRITLGLFKKLFIADYLGKYVTIIHDTPTGFSGFEHLMSMYAYSFQIYFDFSGYSDIAIGIALLLGYRLKDNFDGPYLASNITVFWRKWHISLSTWLKDYIYIPLGGSRKGVINTYIFLLITMLIGGFWHGSDWRFVFWGLAHGLALIIHKIWTKYIRLNPSNKLYSFVGIVVTFHFVSFCWIFFRSSSFSSAFDSLKLIFTNTKFQELYNFSIARPEIAYLILLSMLIVFTPHKYKKYIYDKIMYLPTYIWIFLIILVLQLIIQFKDNLVQPFIYFQF
jgi:D-alanyl-lipoteichoic acid acyltransferase DltB (MBOAT superfamily)